MKRTACCAIIALALAACGGTRSSLPFYRTASMTPEWLGARQASAPTMHHVAPFELTDQHGAIVSDKSLDGEVTIVHFFFTRCGDVCPTTMMNLSRLLGGLRDERQIQILSHSIAPDGDSVTALRAYAAMHGITDPRWHLLTGPRDEIERLAAASYFVRLGDGATYGVATIAHTESVLLVDGCGRLRGIYAGTLALEMQRLREDALALTRENCVGGVKAL